MDVRIVKQNRVCKISVNGEIITPLSFKSFRPTKRNITDFKDAGVRLFSILTSGLKNILGVPYSEYGESWIGEYKYDFDAIDRQIDLFVSCAPNCYFALMIQLDTRKWFLEKNPGCPDSFYYLSQTACNEKWKSQAADYLKAVITHVEEKYGDLFYGYFLLGGKTTEWFSYADHGESHPYKEKWYQNCLNDENAKIPSAEERNAVTDGVFRSSKNNAEAVRYWQLCNNLIADTVLYFAKKAQEVIKHKKLLGVYFGYLFDLLDTRLLEEGHLEFSRIFKSDDIDMISSPSSYYHRRHGDASGFMITLDSLTKSNKIYYLEFDHITYLSPPSVNGVMIPGGDSKLKNLSDTLDVMRRDFMLCSAKGAALWWFDMFEGWFYDERLMKAIKDMVSIGNAMAKEEQYSVSEIAVFAEGAPSMYYVGQNCGLNNEFLNEQLDGLARMGAPYDIYCIDDLETVGTEYKLYIFLNQYNISKERRDTIAQLEKSGKNILWVYASGYVTQSGNTAAGISETVGINVHEKQERDENVVLGEREQKPLSDKISPYFYIDDDNAVEVAKYYSSGKSALAYRETPSAKVFYSGFGNLSAEILRRIAKLSGVHIYNYGTDPIYINSKMIGVYSDTDGDITINLKEDGIFKEMFEGSSVRSEDKKIVIKARRGEPKMFVKYRS